MASSIDESDQKKRIREEELTSESHKWELYYWVSIKEDGKNHMIGRGEFVRLVCFRRVALLSYISFCIGTWYHFINLMNRTRLHFGS